MGDIESPSQREFTTAEPPAPPRDADFSDGSVRVLPRKRRFLLRAGFIFLVLLIPTLGGSYRLSWRTTSGAVRLFIWVIPLCILFLLSCGLAMWWVKRVIRWERYLYVNGIAAVATNISQSRNKHNVHWTYTTHSGAEHSGTSSRINNAVGDRFWVLYDPANPTRAIRWSRFAESGDLTPKDLLQNTHTNWSWMEILAISQGARFWKM